MSRFNFEKYTPSNSTDEETSLAKTLTRHRFFRIGMGVLFGALAGLIYWEFVGCNSGSCGLTSNPYKTVALFAIIGGLMRSDKKGIGCC